MVLGERLELLSLSSAGAARLALRPLDVPPALHATPLRLADGSGCDGRWFRGCVRVGCKNRVGAWPRVQTRVKDRGRARTTKHELRVIAITVA